MGYRRDEKEEIEGWEEMAAGARIACWGGLSGDYYYYPSKHSSIRNLPSYSIKSLASGISTRYYPYINLVFQYYRLSSA